MGFALAAKVPVALVGDIDRGHVIAALAGAHAVLDAADRAAIGGFIISKFRGDPRLFDEGRRSITAYTGWPDLGMVPWLAAAARLPAEDAVVLERETGRYVEPSKVHAIGHLGEHFQVPGMHLSQPSPQRTPVLFQAGASARGQPKTCSAWRFQSMMVPASSICTKASSAVSTMPRASCSLSRSDSAASRLAVMSRPMKKCRFTGSDQVPIQVSTTGRPSRWT